jgi:hypothetical protein
MKNLTAAACLALATSFCLPAQDAVQAPISTELPAKKPGIKRIGVSFSGDLTSAVQADLLTLLGEDPSSLEAIPLTSRVAANRQPEAERKQCDFILETEFASKPKGGGLSLSAIAERARIINNESKSFDQKDAAVSDREKKTTSAENIAKALGTQPKDKVKVSYTLISLATKQPVLASKKDVTGEQLPAFLETFISDVVTAARK